VKKKRKCLIFFQKEFLIIFTVVLKYTKSPDIVSNGFSSITYANNLHPEIGVEKKCIPAASALLVVYIDIPSSVHNFIAFFLEIVTHGLLMSLKIIREFYHL
jgi:hypothetical protein